MAEHQSWQRVTPPGQRAHPPPFPFPPLLQSHPSSFHPFWDVARVLLQSASGMPPSSSSEGQGGDEGARSYTRKHYLKPAASSQPYHGAGRDCGGRVPSGRECAPALPGEVCKHSCSRTGEPLGTRQPGLHRAGAGGRGRQGAEVPRLKPGRQPETTPLLQPPPQAGRAPLQHTKISPTAAGNRLPPTPCRKDTPALGAAHGKGEGANLDSVCRADYAQSPSTPLRVLIS